MTELRLFHGSQNREVHPTFGLGDERHDYRKALHDLDLDLAVKKVGQITFPACSG